AGELEDDVVLLTILLESRHLTAAQQRLERSPDGRHVEPQIRDLRTVDVDPDLGRVELQVRIDALQAGVLADALEHAVRVVLKLLVRSGGLNDELDRPGAAALAERGRVLGEGPHARNAPHLGADLRRELLLLAVAVR